MATLSSWWLFPHKMTLSRPRNSYFGKSGAKSGAGAGAGAGAATLAFFGRGLAFGAARLAEAARLAGRVGAGARRFLPDVSSSSAASLSAAYHWFCLRSRLAPLRLLMAFLKRR